MDKNLYEFQKYIDGEFNCVVISGDAFAVDEALRLIKDKFKDWQSESFFTGEEQRIISSISSFGLFDSSKLIFIYYPENFNQINKKEIINSIKKFSGKNKKIIVITEKENTLSQLNCKFFKFYPIYDSEITSWIIDYVKKNNCKITEDAISMLKLLFGNDRKEIISFLKPILNSGKSIEPKDLFKFNVLRENAVFESIEHFFRKDTKKALEAFIISESENKYYALMLRELNNLIDLKLKKNVDKFQNSFIMKKNQRRLENWKLEELLITFKDVLELESKIKSGYNSFEMTIINIFKLLKGGRYEYG